MSDGSDGRSVTYPKHPVTRRTFSLSCPCRRCRRPLLHSWRTFHTRSDCPIHIQNARYFSVACRGTNRRLPASLDVVAGNIQWGKGSRTDARHERHRDFARGSTITMFGHARTRFVEDPTRPLAIELLQRFWLQTTRESQIIPRTIPQSLYPISRVLVGGVECSKCALHGDVATAARGWAGMCSLVRMAYTSRQPSHACAESKRALAHPWVQYPEQPHHHRLVGLALLLGSIDFRPPCRA